MKLKVEFSLDRIIHFSDFKEPYYFGDRLPLAKQSISESISDEEISERRLCNEYLRHGYSLTGDRSQARDFLRPERKMFGNVFGIYTDGVWIWYGYVIYFHCKYNLILPEAFTSHVLSSDFLDQQHSDQTSQMLSNEFRKFYLG